MLIIFQRKILIEEILFFKDGFNIAFKNRVLHNLKIMKQKKFSYALAGNRTRAARVAGEHSTTEPPVLSEQLFNQTR
jgi:hypothetical protein